MKKILLFVVLLFAGFTTQFTLPLMAQSGNALELDGAARYMRIANHADFNVTTTESFTVSLWVNMAEFKANYGARFVAKRSQSNTLADKSGWELWGANSAAQYCAVNSPNAANNHNNSVSVYATDATAAINTWAHFAFVVDRANGKMYEYLNGVEKANSGTKDISVWACNNAYDVFVGAGATGTYPTYSPITFFKGKIDNLRIWKKALSPAEIIADKTSTVTNTTPGLVAAYDFETITGGTTVADITGNHPGTLVNWPKELLLNKINSLSSSIGTQVGQYVSTQALQDAITAAQQVYNNPGSTDTDFTNATTALNTAIAAATINLPVTSTLGSSETLYAIYSSTRNNATLMDVTAGSNLKSRSYTTAPTSFENTQVWTFVSLNDGTYAIVNPFSNNYITNTNTTANSGKISVIATPYTAAGWKMDKASTSPLTILYTPGQYNGQLNTSSTTGDQEVFNYGYNQGTKNAEGFSNNDAGCMLKVVKVSERTAAAPEPTTDVASGPVASGTPVTITCTNTSDVIYYTLDGTDPKTSGTSVTINGGSGVFNAPVGDFTLKAFVAATQTHFESPVAIYNYSIATGLNNAANKQNVRVNNGIVTVDGVDNFEIYSITGQKLSAQTQLKKGVYLVKISDYTQKVIVK